MKSFRPFGSQPFLSLKDATFRLGDRLVFENTSWVFERRQQWAIIGGNGSGKSLLGDALRGRLPLVHGELRYHFKAPPGSAPEERIGHVSFAERTAAVHETVVQSRWDSIEDDGALSVAGFLSYERVMEINPYEINEQHEEARQLFDRRRRKAVALLDIAPFLERALLSLSNGESQRVHLARALCLPLHLLILDEPFTGLDATRRADFSKVLGRLMTGSLRVLLITTRVDELPPQTSHLLYLNDCRVATAGPRSKILDSHWTRSKRSTRLRIGRAHSMRTFAPDPESGASMAAELVRLRNVTVKYGSATILREINWTIRAGESWALLGPNGSGKTTLLSLILGDNPQAYNNDVRVFGKQRGSGESIWRLKQRIGWVSPELQIHFDASATCFEAVASGFHDTIGLFERPTSRQRAAARHWLAQFELLDCAHEPLFSLSAGLQRMVLLARALVKNPRLLILDEPCQGLDGGHRAEFLKALNVLLERGALTTIYVTHRDEEIPPSIKRVLRLEAGRGIEGFR